MNYKNVNAGLLLSISMGLTTMATAASMATGLPLMFPDASLVSWEERSFVGNTQYELVKESGANVLKATTASTASVLYKRTAIDLTKTPLLNWSWKIDAIYKDINEQTKGGDDFPVRLYVVAKTGVLPWETIAINYVWSSNQAVDTHWQNPHTAKAMMVVVQSGAQKTRQWVSQKRNVLEDFKQYYNRDVKQIAGYAVMVDGDNSSQSGTGYFGNIDFLAE